LASISAFLVLLISRGYSLSQVNPRLLAVLLPPDSSDNDTAAALDVTADLACHRALLPSARRLVRPPPRYPRDDSAPAVPVEAFKRVLQKMPGELSSDCDSQATIFFRQQASRFDGSMRKSSETQRPSPGDAAACGLPQNPQNNRGDL
jgi:hypothetical protein